MIGLFFGTVITNDTPIRVLGIILAASGLIGVLGILTLKLYITSVNNKEPNDFTMRCQLISLSAIIVCLITSIILLCVLFTKEPGKTKENILKALNDKYKDIENLEIADNETGTFTNQGIAYKFYVKDNVLYVKDILKEDNNITAIDGKDY
jgi:hypothetical protein